MELKNQFGEQPKFEIKQVIRQTPFEIPTFQFFLKNWCRMNDSIVPKIVNRNEWEEYKNSKQILARRKNGKHTLYLPNDLQLWEMVGVMEAVDHDTFLAKPEKQIQKTKEMRALGTLFKNSGVYIAQRLDSIDEGKEIARALAEEFYEYGQLLENQKQPSGPSGLSDIVSQTLNPEEVKRVDRFLAGENLYTSRRTQAEREGGN